MSIDGYRKLIDSFVSGNLSAEKFSRQYIDKFKAEKSINNALLFDILEGVFEDIDAFSPDCKEEEETSLRISKETLHRKASSALQQIKVLTGEF